MLLDQLAVFHDDELDVGQAVLLADLDLVDLGAHGQGGEARKCDYSECAKNRSRPSPLIPAQAGIQGQELGPRFRGDERKSETYLSQLLHLNGGVVAPGSIITEVISPQRPHWRDSLVGSFVTGLVAAAIAASACARNSALLNGGPRRCAM